MALQNAAFDSEWNFPFIFGKRGGSTREHLEPQRAEELSRDRGAFHPGGGCTHPASTGGGGCRHTSGSCRTSAQQPQKPPQQRDASNPRFVPTREAREEEMAANSAEQRGSPGPRPRSDARPRAGPRVAVFSSDALPTRASSPLARLICK